MEKSRTLGTSAQTIKAPENYQYKHELLEVLQMPELDMEFTEQLLKDNPTRPESVLQFSIPEGKLFYPEPFIASPSYIHIDLPFLHIFQYWYWLWFMFIFLICFFFISFLTPVRWCNLRTKPRLLFFKLRKLFSSPRILEGFVILLILAGMDNLEFLQYGIVYYFTEFPWVLMYFFTLPWDIIRTNYYFTFLISVLVLCVSFVLPVYYYYSVIRYALMRYNKTARIPLPPQIIPFAVVAYIYWWLWFDVPFLFVLAALTAVFLFKW